MSEPIKAGDLAVIVRPSHCGLVDSIGLVFRVTKVRQRLNSTCHGCGAKLPVGVWVAESESDAFVTELTRLKRIPPLDELESHKQPEELGEAMRNLRELLLTR